MAQITWKGGDSNFGILPAGSGTFDTLGFFGPGGFGFSIPVGEYNSNTYSTNSTGTVASGALPNLKFNSNTTVFVATEGSTRTLDQVALGESTLRIDFTHPTSVKTQNASFRCFDGLNITNDPSGIVCRAFELLGTASGDGQDVISGGTLNSFGDTTWTQIKGTTSLGITDQNVPSGAHTYFIGVSASPSSIGEKTNIGFFIDLEFV